MQQTDGLPTAAGGRGVTILAASIYTHRVYTLEQMQTWATLQSMLSTAIGTLSWVYSVCRPNILKRLLTERGS